MDEKYFTVGKITTTHSYKGEVKAFVAIEYSVYLQENCFVFINEQKYLITNSMPYRHDFLYLKFEGIDDEQSARALVGSSLQLHTSMREPLTEDEYLLEDLIGMIVRTQDGSWEGVLRNVLPYPANDVYVLEKDGKESLVPAVKDIIKSVNVKNKLMIIEPAIGMLS